MTIAPAMTIRAALEEAIARLAGAGVETARLDARLLLGAASGRTVEQIVARPDHALSRSEADAFAALLERRARREPVAQILGHREFWSLDFLTTRDTLTPRPDTETIVEAALKLYADRSAAPRILDLGTGTGCLLVALLSEFPAASGVGIDRSPAAAAIAARNVAAHGLANRAAISVGHWDDSIDGEFDLIVSNPPYITTVELARLDPEVRVFEPRDALDGGVDGLDAYRALGPRLARRLAPNGFAVLELGIGQAEDVGAICAAAGLRIHGRALDLAGRERCVIVKR
ncbi:MAG TPA: peptide chain release factor N(5)-glutamine methyltransferase [Alphaproteobacteria bacterium]|nr:peptide chain release factor N(5)-glutamine methyltransferase [Alphaproteobacteria bacterium]